MVALERAVPDLAGAQKDVVTMIAAIVPRVVLRAMASFSPAFLPFRFVGLSSLASFGLLALSFVGLSALGSEDFAAGLSSSSFGSALTGVGLAAYALAFLAAALALALFASSSASVGLAPSLSAFSYSARRFGWRLCALSRLDETWASDVGPSLGLFLQSASQRVAVAMAATMILDSIFGAGWFFF